MQKTKSFIAMTALVAIALVPAIRAHADEIAPLASNSIVSTETVSDPALAMRSELAELKAKESDISTGTFTRFILRFKIRQLENQLNVKKALQ